METLRNLLSSGKTTDDQTQDSSGTSADPVNSGTSTTTGHTGGLTGEGSHLAKTHDAPRTADTPHIPGAFETSDTTNTGSQTGRDTGLSGTGQQTAQHKSGTAGFGQSPTSPTYTHEQGTGTGLSNTGSTGQGLSSTSNTAGQPIHSSNLANKADPRVDNTNTGFTSNVGQDTGHTTGTTGTGTGTGTHHNLGRDAGIGATGLGAAGLAEHEHRKHEGTGTGVEYGSGPTGQSNYGPGSTSNTTGQPGYSSETTSQPGYSLGTSSNTTGQLPVHSSNLLNKADPRVDSTTTGTSTTGTSGVPRDTNTSSGNHTGREFALGAGAAGLAGEGIHHHRENERDNLGTTTQGGYSGAKPSGQSGAYYGTPTGTAVSGPHSTDTANRLDPDVNKSSGTGLEDALHHSKHHGGGAEEADNHHSSRDSHHTGRDAAIGAGAVGLAEHEHRQHEGTSGVGSHSDNTHTIGTGHSSLRDAAVEQQRGPGASHSGYDNTTHGSSGSHLGRDAAVGAGGVGLAEHEHRKHEGSHSASAPTSGVGQSAYNQSSGTHQPGTGHQTFPVSQSATSGTTKDHTAGTTNDSHKGRDAAGVAGVGALGAGAYEAEKHHKNTQNEPGYSSTSGTTDTSPLPGPAPNTAGPHSKDWMNKLDPRVKSKGDETTTGAGTSHETHDSHKGRDAAAVGALGAGAYEADKHHKKDKDLSHAEKEAKKEHKQELKEEKKEHKQELKEEKKEHKDHHTGRDAGLAGAGLGAGAYEAEKHHHKKDNVNEPYSSTTGTTTTTTTGPHTSNIDDNKSKDHHYGEKAAGAGLVGGAAYEADKHHKNDKDSKATEKEQKKELKEEKKEEKREHKEEKKEYKSGGLFSFLHRDKSKKYTPEEEAEFDRQEREYNSHAGRNTAAGAAGVGALGAGAYEADKHHRANESFLDNKPLPTAPGNHGVGTGAGPGNALAGEHGQADSSHHYGRDAALGAGAAGVGVHEHDKHRGPVPLDEKPPGTDLGDKLHGVDRNRGVQGATSTGQGYGHEDTQSGKGQHHLGRDAAVGAGGIGLAEHEHHKHEGQHAGTETSTGAGYGQTSGISGTGNQYGSEGIHSGTGSAGYGEGQTSGTGLPSNAGIAQGYGQSGIATGTYDQTSGITGAGRGLTTHDAGYTGTDGRNKLHKDPPASHPAAQPGYGQTSGLGSETTSSHVPGSSSERERLVSQGEGRLHQDTGVGHATERNDGVNHSQNY